MRHSYSLTIHTDDHGHAVVHLLEYGENGLQVGETVQLPEVQTDGIMTALGLRPLPKSYADGLDDAAKVARACGEAAVSAQYPLGKDVAAEIEQLILALKPPVTIPGVTQPTEKAE